MVLLINNDENDGGFETLDVVRRYFNRIFTILSKDVREQLSDLNLSKDEIKEVKKELSFLSEEKQKEYLKELAKDNK
ncbi:MAG: hypothetical protein KGD70_13580 [Candidatus Lokiarchaeota archaeon]|nr:hypothetical protein [Candidatus Lokiarchaeota archaeon]